MQIRLHHVHMKFRLNVISCVECNNMLYWFNLCMSIFTVMMKLFWVGYICVSCDNIFGVDLSWINGALWVPFQLNKFNYCQRNGRSKHQSNNKPVCGIRIHSFIIPNNSTNIMFDNWNTRITPMNSHLYPTQKRKTLKARASSIFYVNNRQ